MTVGSVVQAGGEVTKFSSATNNAMGISGIHGHRSHETILPNAPPPVNPQTLERSE
jgi:hypothetical protein